MKKAVIYARVSSKEQEREGYSIPAQIKLLQEYAVKNGFKITKEFSDSETAKQQGRTNFSEMLKYIKKNKDINIILVEKTDRLYRNFKDYVLLDEFKGLEIHLVKENTILSENSKSHDKFIHGIKVLMAKNYIDNLSEEVKKGFLEKAEQGQFPTTPPYGYKRLNSKTIIINPDTAPYIKRAFELYSKATISMSCLIKRLNDEGYIYKPATPKISKGQLERLLKNRFYTGQFIFKGILYQGNHEPLITLDVFNATQQAFRKDNKPEVNLKYQFNFSRLLTCGECGCTITAEQKKEKYIYYRCTNKKANCSQTKYIREEIIEKQIAEAVKKVNITEQHKELILFALKDSYKDIQVHHAERLTQLRKESTKLETRINALYIDKLDGVITESFWRDQHNLFNQKLLEITELISVHQKANKNYMDLGNNFLELAKDAYNTYLGMPAEKKVLFLKNLCQNFFLMDGNISYTYNKPFDLFAEGLNCQVKRGWIDSFRTFLITAA